MMRWLRQGLIIVLLGIGLLGVLEGVLRLAGWPTGRVRSFSKLLNFDAGVWDESIGVFRPGVRSRLLWPPELTYDVHINSLGLRGAEIERTAPAGRSRLLALGDSMTFGFYLEEDQTWPAQLQTMLRARGRDVEVVNAGVGGWSIESETLFLIERGLALEPDHVILAFCANDVVDLMTDRRRVYEGQKDSLAVGGRPWTEVLYSTALYELSLRANVASRSLRRGMDEEEAPAMMPLPEPPERAWEEYARWLRRLHEVLEERDISLTLAYVPDAYRLSYGVPANDEARLRALARELGISFASPLAWYETEPVADLYHLPTDGHISARGAELVARAVADSLPTAVTRPARIR